jgi:hypothetical protein
MTATRSTAKAAAPAKKAAARSARPHPEHAPTKGHYVPHKEDREAFARGEITPRARRMNRIVDACFRTQERLRGAQTVYENAILGIFDKNSVAGRGFTAVSADGMRRVIIDRRNTVSGNQNAIEAKGLIDEYTAELLGRRSTNDDDRQMAEFLGSIVQESKGRILLNKRIIMFRRMKFTDERLVKAQKLLVDAFEVTESKMRMICQKRVGDDWTTI